MKWKLGIVLFAVAIVAFVVVRRWSPATNALRTRELATRGLGAYLAERFAGHCGIVVSNPFTKQKGLAKDIYAYEEAGLKGLREGFGERVKSSVVFPELKAEARQNPYGVASPESTTTPLSYLVAEGAFDKIAQQHPECDLMVSLIGIPAGFEQLSLSQSGDKHVLAFLLPDLRVAGDLPLLRKAVQSGKIAAFVLAKPGAPPEQARSSGNWKEEFEKRFFLVTRENFDESARLYPQLFSL